MSGGTEFLMQVGLKMQGDPASQLQAVERSLKQGIDAYRQLESQAASAGRALEKSGAGLEKMEAAAGKAKAGGDEAKYAELSGQIEAAKAKHLELAAASDKANAAMKAQQGTVDKLANEYSTLKKQEDGAKSSNEAFLKGSDGLSKLPGPLREVGAKAKELQEGWGALVQSMGKSKAMALVGVAAFALIGAAVLAAAAALAVYVLKLGNARRDQLLTLSSMKGLGDAAGTVQASFIGITRETSIANDRLAEMTKELVKAKVPAEDIPEALKALAKQEAALGDSSGTGELIKDLESGKKSVSDLGKEMEKQFGQNARKKALGLDQQMTILKANVEDLFSGANIDGVLKGFSRLVKLLDSSTVSGRAIKSIFDSMFGGLGGADAIFIGIERGILVFMTNVLKAINFVRSLGAALGLAGTSGKSSFDGMAVASALAQAAFFTVAVGVAVVAASLYALWGIVQLGIAAWNALSSGATTAWANVNSAASKAVEALRAFDLSEIGANMMAGLIKGIKSKAGEVASTMTGVVGPAVDGLRNFLDEHSPSRLFADIGANTALGFAMGVEGEAGAVDSAVTHMVDPPSPAMPRSRSEGPRGGPAIVIEHLTINAGEGVDGASIADALIRELERAAAQLGAAT